MEEKYLWEIIDKLRDEIRQLKADIKHDMGVCEDYDEGLRDEIKALREQVSDLMIDKDRLVEQVSSKWTNNSNVHTIRGEIAEYMSHNDKCMGARMFLIPRDEFKHGEYDNTIYWEDGME